VVPDSGVEDPELEEIIGAGSSDGDPHSMNKEWYPYEAKMVRLPSAFGFSSPLKNKRCFY
jgi:hypothetical protein